MKIDILVTGPLGVNCYLISKDGDVVIVDPGGHQEDIEHFIKSNKLNPLAVVNTHGHFDHIGAVAGLCADYKIPFMLHKDDEFLLAQGSQVMKMYNFGSMDTPIITSYLEHGQILELGSIKIEIIHTPGHTPGGCCLYLDELNSVITGDTLFLESVGRADFPYADGNQLLKNIKERLFRLDDGTRVYPGHGAASTIGHEKDFNPYL